MFLSFLASPVGRTVAEVAAAILLFVCAWGYAEHRGASIASAKCDATIANLSSENAKAVADAVEKQRAEDSESAAILRDTIDAYDARRKVDEKDSAFVRKAVQSAPKSADRRAPKVILDAIHGGAK